MLNFKNKEGKIVLSENTETGEVKVFDEKLQPFAEKAEEANIFAPIETPEPETEEEVVE